MGSNKNHLDVNYLNATENGDAALEEGSFETVCGFDADQLLDHINNVEDLDELDGIYTKVLEEMQYKAELLKSIQQQNEEMKNVLNSKKCFGTELEQHYSKEKERCNNLREMIEAKRVELEQLHEQQVEDLEQFENDVVKITEKFRSAPNIFEPTSLTETVEQLQKDLEGYKAEMLEYKQDLHVAEDKLKLTHDDSYCDTTLKVFEESISDIKTLNERLSFSVEQFTSEVNSLRFQMSLLNLPK